MLVPTSSHVWDCACGNGQATLDLAERFARVVATDGSQEQIASAAPHPKVEYRVALAEQSGLPDRSVGLVTVAQALHWFDFDFFYAEVKRVLNPGGVLAAWAYGINQVEGDAANEIVQDFYSNVVGPYWPPERRLVEEGYRTIPFRFPKSCHPFLGWKRTGRWNSCSGISVRGPPRIALFAPRASTRSNPSPLPSQKSGPIRVLPAESPGP